jgi:hypothetical protein
MQLKRHKRSLFLLFSIPAILILTAIVNKPNLSVIEEDLTQKIISFDPGFSSFISLIDDGVGNDRFSIGMINKLSHLFSSVGIFIPKVIKYKLLTNVEFEKIDINIDFSDYLTLMEDRRKAINNSILFNPSKVDASLKFNGKKYRAGVRLKGDLGGHWLSKRRFSLRVNLKNNKTIFGFSDFSIQKPRERQHPYDHSFQSMLRSLNNLTSVHKFAHVFVNGEDWGIMDIEEHVSTKFLEKQNKKDSIIVRFSNEEKWVYLRSTDTPHNGYKISDPKIFLHLYNKKSLKNIRNREMYSFIFKNRMLGKDIYDNNSFSRAFLMSLVWNNDHTIAHPNIKYYFNPYTLELEPITTDQGHWSEINDDHVELNENTGFLFSNEVFLDNLSENIKYVEMAISKIDEYLSAAQSFFPVDKKKDANAVKSNLKKILSNKEKYIVGPALKVNENLGEKHNTENKFQTPTKQHASDFNEHLNVKHYADGTIELYNLIPDTVNVESIFFDDIPIHINELFVPSYLKELKPTIIKTPYIGIQDEKITVNTQYKGFKRKSKNKYTLIKDGIENPLLLDTVKEFSFIKKTGDKAYQVNPGHWKVHKPIVVDGDLIISPNTSLSLSKDSYIIVKGSLTAIGGDSSPISFNAISDKWKGIYVLKANNKSQLRNVDIRDVKALEDGLLRLTGAINFYKSDVDFENIKVENIEAEDAINIIESLFSFRSLTINNTLSDGLDSDFSEGNIALSQFINIGGDALDFSGSNVLINNVKAINVRDKAVSAGEKSIINIDQSYFKDVGVGVASKDGSSVNLSNSSVDDYKLYAAMSYVKKDFYSSPSIEINNTSVSDGNEYIRQKGSNMSVDNIMIPESKINVKKLYDTNEMSK